MTLVNIILQIGSLKVLNVCVTLSPRHHKDIGEEVADPGVGVGWLAGGQDGVQQQQLTRVGQFKL